MLFMSIVYEDDWFCIKIGNTSIAVSRVYEEACKMLNLVKDKIIPIGLKLIMSKQA